MAAKSKIEKDEDSDNDLLSDLLPEDQQEDLSDLGLGAKWYFGAVLWSTDWTTQTILSQLARGNINLNPRFQRRNAWTDLKKSLFIESLILGLPIPQIIFAEDNRRKGSFIVIDGKQRLLTLRQFVAEKNDPNFNQLVLTGLEDRKDLNGKTYLDLQKSPELVEDRNTFENQTIRTVVIRNWKDDKYLYSVFLRINTGSVQLSPQELRQALFPGSFSDFVDDFATNSKLLKSMLGLKQPDFRMRDIELVLRFFAYNLFVREYDGNLKAFLDHTAEFLNAAWDKDHIDLERRAAVLESTIDTTRKIFGKKNEFRKWNGERYERRINRAVFDIMTYYFSDPDIAQAALKIAPKIKNAFETVCVEIPEFRSALETTTKSRDANSTRFGIWAELLADLLHTKIKSPI